MGKVKSFSAKLAHETSNEGKSGPVCKAEIKRVKLVTNKKVMPVGHPARISQDIANATRQTSGRNKPIISTTLCCRNKRWLWTVA